MELPTASEPILSTQDFTDQALQKQTCKKQAIWSVYLIRTARDQLYCGVTTDVDRRFEEHQSSPRGAKYLKGKGPLSLVWSHSVGDKRTAMQLEYRIKRLTKARKEQLILQSDKDSQQLWSLLD